jgi:hypothetical protein
MMPCLSGGFCFVRFCRFDESFLQRDGWRGKGSQEEEEALAGGVSMIRAWGDL